MHWPGHQNRWLTLIRLPHLIGRVGGSPIIRPPPIIHPPSRLFIGWQVLHIRAAFAEMSKWLMTDQSEGTQGDEWPLPTLFSVSPLLFLVYCALQLKHLAGNWTFSQVPGRVSGWELEEEEVDEDDDVGGPSEWVVLWDSDGDLLINLLRTWLVGGFVGRRLFRACSKAYPYPVVACA